MNQKDIHRKFEDYFKLVNGHLQKKKTLVNGVIWLITGATLVESSLGYAFVSLKKVSQDSNPTLVLCNHAFTILFWT